MNEPIREYIKNSWVVGYRKCPKWLKEAYEKAVNYECQQCKEHYEHLEPHRIKRGNVGGLYTVAPINSIQSNVKPVCNRCHKKIHSKEDGCRGRNSKVTLQGGDPSS